MGRAFVHFGRFDHQVKIRGFRIELGEIETVLSRHPGRSSSRGDSTGGSAGSETAGGLCGLRRRGGSAKSTELRSFAERRFRTIWFLRRLCLKAMPLTANNKVDVRALPAPAPSITQIGSCHIGPRDRVEVQLTALWQQVLEVPKIGIHDNFFDSRWPFPQGGPTLLSSRTGVWKASSARDAVSSADHCRVSVGPFTRDSGRRHGNRW